MAVIREQIILRRRRKDGDRLPNRVKLDKVGEKDSLIIEIVVDKKNGIIHWYRFLPEQMSGRRAVVFTVSGGEVYWLSGAKPDRIYESDLPEEPQPEPTVKHRGRKPKTGTKSRPMADPDWRKRPRARKVMIFDAAQNLAAVCSNLNVASDITHILTASIHKLCKNKKPSQDTGLSFRYLWKKLDFDVTDFNLTLAKYDELCKRAPKETEDSTTEDQ